MAKPKPLTLKRGGAKKVVDIHDTPAYLRGADAPSEMRAAREPKFVTELGQSAYDDFGGPLAKQHIEDTINQCKVAHDFVVRNDALGDRHAIAELHRAAEHAYKAIALLRKRTPR